LGIRFLVKTVSLFVIGSLALFSGCTNKKTTGPADEPNEPAQTVMQEYFPLNYGDSWTWEVTCFQVAEEFVDGDSSLGEPYEDDNHNGRYDYGEFYEDVNYNGKYDSPNDPWEPPIPYADRNGNGEYDLANGTWETGELFLDLDYDGTCDMAYTLTLYASILYPYPQDGVITRGGQFLGTFSNGEPGTVWGDGGVWGDADGFSNDSLGLRWHSHIDRISSVDFLGLWCQPITIAKDSIEVGDSVITGCSHIWSSLWISVFEGTEDVTVPAGTFEDCLKFKFEATDWDHSMQRFNGTSYQWYAKGVGLVKSSGPGKSEYIILKSATIGTTNYP
jgi:hypothetical protein